MTAGVWMIRSDTNNLNDNFGVLDKLLLSMNAAIVGEQMGQGSAGSSPISGTRETQAQIALREDLASRVTSCMDLCDYPTYFFPFFPDGQSPSWCDYRRSALDRFP